MVDGVTIIFGSLCIYVIAWLSYTFVATTFNMAWFRESFDRKRLYEGLFRYVPLLFVVILLSIGFSIVEPQFNALNLQLVSTAGAINIAESATYTPTCIGTIFWIMKAVHKLNERKKTGGYRPKVVDDNSYDIYVITPEPEFNEVTYIEEEDRNGYVK